mmetsp:Transcript_192/g.216  ORF Transcript_192/g.216 Transcript_192/m.216 type:complete len:174 (+) Transcript_192:12-533(+)
MPAYHSKFNSNEGEEMCGCTLLPIKTKVRGPAPPMAAEDEDIIDETIKFFRANVFFRNFEVKGGADRTLVYLTLCIGEVLKECERIDKKADAEKLLKQISMKGVSAPGEAGWTLGGMYPPGKNVSENDSFKGYFKQCREEIGIRMLDILYLPDGSKNKWWQSFSKRKFMGKTL